MQQPHTSENPGAGTPGLETFSKNQPEKHSGIGGARQRDYVDETRLRYLARRLHALGERPVFEYLREVVAGANALERLEAFSRLDPAIVAAIGADLIPTTLHVFHGGRA